MSDLTAKTISADFKAALLARCLTGEVPSVEDQTRLLEEVGVQFQKYDGQDGARPVSNFTQWATLSDPEIAQSLEAASLPARINPAKPSIDEQWYPNYKWKRPDGSYDGIWQGMQTQINDIRERMDRLTSIIAGKVNALKEAGIENPGRSQLDEAGRTALMYRDCLATYSMVAFRRGAERVARLHDWMVANSAMEREYWRTLTADVAAASFHDDDGAENEMTKLLALGLSDSMVGIYARRQQRNAGSILASWGALQVYYETGHFATRKGNPSAADAQLRVVQEMMTKQMDEAFREMDANYHLANYMDKKVTERFRHLSKEDAERLENLVRGFDLVSGSKELEKLLGESRLRDITNAVTLSAGWVPKAEVEADSEDGSKSDKSGTSNSIQGSETGKGGSKTKKKKRSKKGKDVARSEEAKSETSSMANAAEDEAISIAELRAALRKAGLYTDGGLLPRGINIAPASGRAGSDWDAQAGTVTISRPEPGQSTGSSFEPSRTNEYRLTFGMVNGSDPRYKRESVKRVLKPQTWDITSKNGIGKRTPLEELNAALAKTMASETNFSEEDIERMMDGSYSTEMGTEDDWKDVLRRSGFDPDKDFPFLDRKRVFLSEDRFQRLSVGDEEE